MCTVLWNPDLSAWESFPEMVIRHSKKFKNMSLQISNNDFLDRFVNSSIFPFSFRTGKGVGYSAHFSGPMLVIESAVRQSKREIRYVRHLVGHQFYPQKVNLSNLHSSILYFEKRPSMIVCRTFMMSLSMCIKKAALTIHQCPPYL